MNLIHCRSEERFSRNAETDLVCRLLLEKKKTHKVRRLVDESRLIIQQYHVHLIFATALPRSCLSIYHSRSSFSFFFESYVYHRDLHSFPTRRSSDLIRVNRAKKSGMVNITSSVNSRERSGINTILHELNPL